MVFVVLVSFFIVWIDVEYLIAFDLKCLFRNKKNTHTHIADMCNGILADRKISPFKMPLYCCDNYVKGCRNFFFFFLFLFAIQPKHTELSEFRHEYAFVNWNSFHHHHHHKWFVSFFCWVFVEILKANTRCTTSDR